MNLVGPARFKLNYTPKAITSRIDESGKGKFSGLMTGNQPKLYVFSRENTPVYVGATITSMSSRLWRGWNDNGKNGSWGYSFRQQGSQIDLDVWVDFDEVKKREDGARSGSDIETIEAEVVYLLRHRTGKWPAHQTEIHFYQSNADHHREAEKVLARYGIRE